jgi:hypothetical protein
MAKPLEPAMIEFGVSDAKLPLLLPYEEHEETPSRQDIVARKQKSGENFAEFLRATSKQAEFIHLIQL